MTDEKTRCDWHGVDPLYVAYHDTEWGVPEWDDRALFEKLILDGFQAGLSWITILRKRDGFRDAFCGFDPEVIARWGSDEAETLRQDARIVRNRAKIAATITNAQAWLQLQESEPGGFSAFLWSFVGGAPRDNRFDSLSQIPAETPESKAMSKALKKRGFKFCGPTICYAFMQAVGMVNDHLRGCFRYDQVS